MLYTFCCCTFTGIFCIRFVINFILLIFLFARSYSVLDPSTHLLSLSLSMLLSTKTKFMRLGRPSVGTPDAVTETPSLSEPTMSRCMEEKKESGVSGFKLVMIYTHTHMYTLTHTSTHWPELV